MNGIGGFGDGFATKISNTVVRAVSLIIFQSSIKLSSATTAGYNVD